MANNSMKIKVEFSKGTDVVSESEKFRKILTDNNVDVFEETYTENSVSFSAARDSEPKMIPVIGTVEA